MKEEVTLTSAIGVFIILAVLFGIMAWGIGSSSVALRAEASIIQDQSTEYQWKVFTCPDTQSDIEKTLKEMEKWKKENKDRFAEVYEPVFPTGFQFHALIRYKLKKEQ
ncbi:MAG: hypothetical protein AAB885_02310 [Patescibacteria group bacterium]